MVGGGPDLLTSTTTETDDGRPGQVSGLEDGRSRLSSPESRGFLPRSLWRSRDIGVRDCLSPWTFGVSQTSTRSVSGPTVGVLS